MSKNSGLLPIRAVNSILEGKDNELPENMSSDIISSLKFCPLTSINVERSFSVYESVFGERESLTTENLAKIMICKCYYSKNEWNKSQFGQKFWKMKFSTFTFTKKYCKNYAL